jgi:hypothetical protein
MSGTRAPADGWRWGQILEIVFFLQSIQEE